MYVHIHKYVHICIYIYIYIYAYIYRCTHIHVTGNKPGILQALHRFSMQLSSLLRLLDQGQPKRAKSKISHESRRQGRNRATKSWRERPGIWPPLNSILNSVFGRVFGVRGNPRAEVDMHSSVWPLSTLVWFGCIYWKKLMDSFF